MISHLGHVGRLGHLGRRAGAAAALAAAALVATPASPASAQSGPTITITEPKTGQILEVPAVSVKGSVEAGTLYQVKEVTLAIGTQAPQKAPCTGPQCSFSGNLALPPVNGPYQLKVTASTETLLGLLAGPSAERVLPFAVAAPPKAPVLDTPKVTDARTVELSWSRNTEADMLYYVVFRKDPGGSAVVPVSGKVDQPPPGSKARFTDTTTSAFNGGAYAYQVAAVRKGSSGTDATEAKSASASVTATVPAPPTTTTVAPPPGSPAAAGPTTTAKPGPPAGVDLSGFLSSRSQPVVLPPITVPEPPDTGFGSLPFGARPPGEDLEEGDADAVLPKDARRSTSVISRIDPSRPLVPVAGGLVLLLLATHMRVLNRRVKPASGDLTVVEGPAPRAGAMEIVPAPAFAVVDEPDSEEDWAPVGVAIETDPEPEIEPGPEPVAELEPEPVAEVEPVLVATAAPGPEMGPAPDPPVVDLWAPAALLGEPDDAAEDSAPDPDAVEVHEMVSPTRRRLVRAGSR